MSLVLPYHHLWLFLPQTTSSALKGAIQLGIGYTVGNLSSKPERDVLMQDFYVVESIFFPRLVFIFTPETQRHFILKKNFLFIYLFYFYLNKSKTHIPIVDYNYFSLQNEVILLLICSACYCIVRGEAGYLPNPSEALNSQQKREEMERKIRAEKIKKPLRMATTQSFFHPIYWNVRE